MKSYRWSDESDTAIPRQSYILFSEPTRHQPSLAERDTEAALYQIGKQIQELQKALQDAQEELRKTQQLLFRERAGRAPIRYLPDDILLHIFGLGADQALSLDCPDMCQSARQLPFQIKVSYVCSRWRRLALQTPALWSVYSIQASYSTSPIRWPMDLWLRRSGRTDLTFHMRASWAWVEWLAEILEKFSDRIITLSIKCALREYSRVFPMISQSLRRLKVFDLQLIVWQDDDATIVCNMSQNPSRPLQVESLRVRSGIAAGTTGISLPHLKHLDIWCPQKEESSAIWVVLPSCESLRKLQMGGYCFPSEEPSTVQGNRCVLPNLEHLDLTGELSPLKWEWLDQLVIPVLQTLMVSLLKEEDGGLARAARSPRPGMQINSESFLRKCNDVTALRIGYFYAAGTVDAELGHLFMLLRKGLLPRLHTLTLCGNGLPASDWQNYRTAWPKGIRRAMSRLPACRANMGMPLGPMSVIPPLNNGDGRYLNGMFFQYEEQPRADDEYSLCLQDDEISAARLETGHRKDVTEWFEYRTPTGMHSEGFRSSWDNEVFGEVVAAVESLHIRDVAEVLQ